MFYDKSRKKEFLLSPNQIIKVKSNWKRAWDWQKNESTWTSSGPFFILNFVWLCIVEFLIDIFVLKWRFRVITFFWFFINQKSLKMKVTICTSFNMIGLRVDFIHIFFLWHLQRYLKIELSLWKNCRISLCCRLGN